jgi:hypothetical protein
MIPEGYVLNDDAASPLKLEQGVVGRRDVRLDRRHLECRRHLGEEDAGRGHDSAEHDRRGASSQFVGTHYEDFG